MKRVQLGASRVWVSEQIFGALAIGWARFDESRRIATIHSALDAGVTTFDTAPLYDFGLCEQQVGRALREVRHHVQVMTKVGLRWDDPRGEIMFTCKDEHGQPRAVRRNSRPDSLRVEVDRSLKRLGVDAIDCVHVHQLDPETPIADTMGTLAGLLRAGKIRAIGVSTNFGPRELLEAQAALGDVPLASVQLTYSLIDRGCERELMPLARERGVAVLAHSALERGLLAGTLPPLARLDASDVRLATPACQPANVARVNRVLETTLAPIARRHVVSIAQVVLAWVRQHSLVSAVVVGASGPEQARVNARAFELTLEPSELVAVREAFDALKLDPYAGVSLLDRVRPPATRVLRRVRRTVLAAADGLRIVPRRPGVAARQTRLIGGTANVP
jgi:aryl-alcohol dehydrogenase-like predicted oxidoreductase